MSKRKWSTSYSGILKVMLIGGITFSLFLYISKIDSLPPLLKNSNFQFIVPTVITSLSLVYQIFTSQATSQGSQLESDQNQPDIVDAVNNEMAKNAKVTILSPLNGERCPHATHMRGEVSNLAVGKELWIIKEPHTGSYHPDTGPVIVEGKKWMGTAFIGNNTLNADNGRNFTIHIVMCSHEAGRRFKDYLSKAHQTDGWVGFPTLFDGKKMATVSVVRDDSVFS